MAIKAPDLSKQPPRSARVRLGGYALLPRMLDKGRASVAGTIGEYKYACPLDQRFLDYAGVDPAALKKQLAAGKGDAEILAWIEKNAKNEHSAVEIEAWSIWQERRAPDNPEGREYFNELHKKLGADRTDLISWADILDLDDFVSFGGQA